MEWTRRKPFPPPPQTPQTPVRRSVNLIIVLLYYVTMPWQHLLSFQYKKEEEGESLFRSMSRSERWEREREKWAIPCLREKRGINKKRDSFSLEERHIYFYPFSRARTHAGFWRWKQRRRRQRSTESEAIYCEKFECFVYDLISSSLSPALCSAVLRSAVQCVGRAMHLLRSTTVAIKIAQ